MQVLAQIQQSADNNHVSPEIENQESRGSGYLRLKRSIAMSWPHLRIRATFLSGVLES
ncbi:hypothetical protein VNI00_014557, partial [Paramarasmius palmivorus]